MCSCILGPISSNCAPRPHRTPPPAGQFVRDNKKRRADARLRLQRVAHEAWGSAKELWVSERAMQLLTIWHRYAVFRTCKRADQGIPLFAEHVEKWTQFVTAYEDRKLREAAANRLFPLVRLPCWGIPSERCGTGWGWRAVECTTG